MLLTQAERETISRGTKVTVTVTKARGVPLGQTPWRRGPQTRC